MATFDGTAGDDTYDGTDDADTIMGYAGADVLSGAGGGDVIDGGAGNDQLFGGAGDDVLTGGAGRNRLSGEDGDDRLHSSSAGDRVDGGSGNDIWYADLATTVAGLRYDLAAGSVSGGGTFTGVEQVVIRAGYGDDTFVSDGLVGFDLDGGGGDDTLVLDRSAAPPTVFRDVVTLRLDGAGISGTIGDGPGGGMFSAIDSVDITGRDNDRGDSEHYNLTVGADFRRGAVTIDAGKGRDLLSIDLQRVDGVDFQVDADDVAHAGFGTFSNFDSFRIFLGSGSNRITTGRGSDDITINKDRSATGIHVVDGGDGDDTVSLWNGISTVRGGKGFDRLTTTVHDDGVSFDDTTGIFSNGIREHGFELINLNMAGADATLDLSTGATIRAELHSPGHIVVDRSGTADSVAYVVGTTAVSFLQTSVTAAEGATVDLTAGAGNDTVTYTQTAAGETGVALDGGAGFDTLVLSLLGSATLDFRSDRADYRDFEAFRIDVSASGNAITTADGADAITIRGENNTVLGGGGNDVIVLTHATGDAIGVNFLSGNGGDDRLTGSSDADTLHGNPGNDLLQGGAGDDQLMGGTGDDILDGGAGDDTASYADAKAGVTVTLASSTQQDTRGAGHDLLVAVENIVGSIFADRLTGNDGANRIYGGAGSDRLTGGGGADVFGFAGTDLSGNLRDRILDFDGSSGDRIDLSGVDAVPGAAGDQAFALIGSAAFSGNAGELRLIEQQSDTVLVKGDLDGDGMADFTLQVHTDAPLVAADFVL